MGCDASQGYQGRLAVKAGAAPITWSSGASLLEIQSESIRKASTIVNTAGLRGTRAREVNRTREGVFSIGGTISMNPSPRDFGILLPLMGFDSAVPPTFTLTEGLAVFGVIVDRVADIFEYENCLCQGFTLSSSEGQIVDMQIDLVADNEDIAGAPAWPTLTYPSTAASNPFMFFDSAIVINGNTYQCNSFSISVQHSLDIKYRNNQKPTSFCTTDRVITFGVSLPYTADELALYPLNSAVAGSVTLTNGTVSTAFNFTNLRTSNNTPVIPGRSEIGLELAFEAFSSGATLEMTIVNDETP